MKRIKKMFSISYDLEWKYGVTISKIKEDLEALEKLGATHINIEPYLEWDNAYVNIDALCEREETDSEYRERIRELKSISFDERGIKKWVSKNNN